MPTLVKFASGESVMLSASFDLVSQQLATNPSGQFAKGDGTRVVVFAANIEVLQDAEGSDVPLVDAR